MTISKYQEFLNKQRNKNDDLSQLIALSRWIRLNPNVNVNYELLEKRMRTEEGKFLARLILLHEAALKKATENDLIRAASAQQLGTGKAWQYYYEIMKDKKASLSSE